MRGYKNLLQMGINNILAYTLGPVGSALLSFIILPVMAWMYSPDDIGRYALLQLLVSASFLVCSFGLEQAFVREFYEHPNNAALLKTTFLIGFIVVSVLALYLIVGDAPVSTIFFDLTDHRVSSLLALCLVSNFISTFALLSLRMKGQAVAYSLVNISNRAVFLLFILALYYVQAPKTFASLISAFAVSSLGASLLALWLSWSAWRAAYKANFLWLETRKLLLFSLPLMLGGISYWGLSSLDRVMLKAMSSLNELGTFSIAASFAGVAAIARTIFTTIWTPLIFKWNKEGIVIARLSKIQDQILFVIVVVWALCGSCAWMINFVLPKSYDAVSSLVAACMAVPLIYTISETTIVGLYIVRKTFYAMLASTASLLVAAVLLYAFVPVYGASGAASATCIGFFVFLVLRTELSVLFWSPFPRFRIYGFIFLCVSMSVLQTLLPSRWETALFFAWALMLVFTLIFFRVYIRDYWKLLARMTRQNTHTRQNG